MSQTITLKTSVTERDIVNYIVDDSKKEWLSEINELKDDYNDDDDMEAFQEAETFLKESNVHDTHEYVNDSNEYGFSFINQGDGLITGSLWLSSKINYDCSIVDVKLN